jgi:hypothetical protein
MEKLTKLQEKFLSKKILLSAAIGISNLDKINIEIEKGKFLSNRVDIINDLSLLKEKKELLK